MAKQVSVKDFEVNEVNHTEVDRILERNHYLGKGNGIAKHRYLVLLNMLRKGAMMWDKPTARMEEQEKAIELKRFWTADDTPHNLESHVLSKMMRDMREYGYERCIAYASVVEEHWGTIYLATNWVPTSVTKRGDTWDSDTRDRDTKDDSEKIKYEWVPRPHRKKHGFPEQMADQEILDAIRSVKKSENKMEVWEDLMEDRIYG